MRFWKSCTTAVVALALAAGSVYAQDDPNLQIEKKNTGAGTTAAEFMLLGAGARGMALGPAYSAITRDAEALYYNPAALPLMEGMQGTLTVMPYFADTNYLWGGVAMPIAGGEYGIGLSFSSFGFSDQPVYTEADQENSEQLTYDVSEIVASLSFAHAFIDRFSGGFTLKLISDQLGQSRANAVALDIGTHYHAELAGRPISMAFVIQNLGTDLKHSGGGLDLSAFPTTPDPSFPVQGVDPIPARFEAQASPLPVVFRVGVAYDAISAATSRLTLGGEFNEYYNNAPAFGLSSEYMWMPQDLPLAAAFRASYAYQPDNSLSGEEETNYAGATDPTDQEMDGLAIGGGLVYNLTDYQIRADYAWRHFGVLGSRSAFSVSIGWR